MSIRKIDKNKKKVELLIKGWEELMVLGCIDEDIGEIYVDSIDKPNSVQFIVGGFYFFAGSPNIELVENIKNSHKNFSIMTSNNNGWHKLIEGCYINQYKKIKRYAIKKEKDVFDRDKLEGIVKSLNSKYQIKLIDANLYKKVMKEKWSRDLCLNFLSAEDYLNRGIGVIILDGNKIVSGASSYIACKNAIEIEIDTKKEYRRKGLASVVGAKLILECLNKNIYPSWDAANLWSVALAEKLGYHFSHEYIAYEVRW